MIQRRSFFQMIALAAISWISVSAAGASPIEVNLVAQQQGIQPGEPFYVGLHMKPKRHYHTYYKHPGIVGVPTGIDWQLPKGWKADPITWPEPKRVMMFTIQAQGYHGEHILPIKIHPPKDLVQGSKVEIQGKASWMCCYRDCNPGSEVVTLALEVNPQKAQLPGKEAKLFQAAFETVPSPLENYRAQASIKGDQVHLLLQPTNEKAVAFTEVFFISENELIDPSQPQEVTFRKDGGISLILPISKYAMEPKPKKLEGLLQIDRPWRADSKSTSARLEVKL